MKKDEIILNMERILGQNFPCFKGVDSYFQKNGETIDFQIDCDSLRDSKYFVEYNNAKFLHFTNLGAAIEILYSKSLRVSNLNTFRDPDELLHGLDLVGINNEYKELKRYTFAASFTELKNLDVKNNYQYHWTNYANNGMGVALEFEFKNLLPERFYILKVNYCGKNNEDVLLNLIKEELIKKKPSIRCLLPILTLIKKEDFKQEEEVRLLYYSDSDFCRDWINDYHLNQYEINQGFDILPKFGEENELEYRLNIPFSTLEIKDDKSFITLNSVTINDKIHSMDDNNLIRNHLSQLCKMINVKLIE